MPFDPGSIPPYSVIRIPVYLNEICERKRFVVLSHFNSCAIVIKPTSKIEQFTHNKNLAAGVVMYKAGEVAVFEKATAVDPGNQFAIPHKELIDHHTNGELEILGILPPEFEADLRDAIDDSMDLSPRKKDRLRSLLRPPPSQTPPES